LVDLLSERRIVISSPAVPFLLLSVSTRVSTLRVSDWISSIETWLVRITS